MTHHLLPEIDRDWLARVTNCFLIRHPREVITSYIAKNNDPALEDVGFVQQAEIFDLVRVHSGATPPVLDAKDIQENPRRMLGLLCDRLRWNSPKPCSRGRRGCARPTASGPNTGTKKSNVHVVPPACPTLNVMQFRQCSTGYKLYAHRLR